MQQRKKAFWVEDENYENYYASARDLADLQEVIDANKIYCAGDFILIDTDGFVEFENFNIRTLQKVKICNGQIIKVIDIDYTLHIPTQEKQETSIQDVLKLLGGL
jgi:hypothetical protein